MRKNKIINLIIAVVLCSTALFDRSYSIKYMIGQDIGDVVTTNILTTINGYNVPTYNIGGNTIVIASDLDRFGFDIKWNEGDRSVSIERNYSKIIFPIEVEKSKVPYGKKIMDVIYSDIKVYVKSTVVDSFNLMGMTAINVNSLNEFGNISWDPIERKVKIELRKNDIFANLDTEIIYKAIDSISYDDGDYFNGEFISNVRNGYGEYTFKNGERYQGQWANDMMNGSGKYIYINGDSYNGNWTKNMMNGRGVYLFNNGDVYSGEWINNMRDGNGEYYFKSGQILKGSWKNNLFVSGPYKKYYFTIGSSKESVLDIMGLPVMVIDEKNLKVLYYANSTVEFDTNWNVISWNNSGKNLLMSLGDKTPSASGVGIGSSIKEVIDAKGTPFRIINNTYTKSFYYDSEIISFNSNWKVSALKYINND